MQVGCAKNRSGQVSPDEAGFKQVRAAEPNLNEPGVQKICQGEIDSLEIDPRQSRFPKFEVPQVQPSKIFAAEFKVGKCSLTGGDSRKELFNIHPEFCSEREQLEGFLKKLGD